MPWGIVLKSLPEKKEILKISVGFRNSEVYIRLGEQTIILPPSAAKKLTSDLAENIKVFEADNGVVKMPKSKKSKSGHSLPKLLKSLYKSRRVTKKLVSVNTSRKK